MYTKKLIDGEYYPVAGAPQAYYISVLYPRVCSTCFLLYSQLADSNYWKEIQETMKEERRRTKKLRSGEDYLSA